jgi:hypothetical protein
VEREKRKRNKKKDGRAFGNINSIGNKLSSARRRRPAPHQQQEEGEKKKQNYKKRKNKKRSCCRRRRPMVPNLIRPLGYWCAYVLLLYDSGAEAVDPLSFLPPSGAKSSIQLLLASATGDSMTSDFSVSNGC